MGISPLGVQIPPPAEAHLDITMPIHHDVCMKTRTTLTLDEDVAQYLKQESRIRNKPFKQVLNETVRRGMKPGARRARPGKFKVVPNDSGFAPGVDPENLKQLDEELEIEEFLKKQAE